VDDTSSVSLTQTGAAIGTPAYMSPEQLLGHPVDIRTDIYSLGCVVYEMLTGAPPHAAATAAAMAARRLSEPICSLTATRFTVSAAIERATLRALRNNPGDRFDTMEAFITALQVPVPVEASKITSLLVLPFENASPAVDDEYFSDGLTDELIADLSRLRSVRVISRASARTLKHATKSLPVLARELDVQFVLTGTVRRAGPQLRITAELIEARTDSQIWSDRHIGVVDDVFSMQSRLSSAIVDALRVQLSAAELKELSARPLANIHAYERYLRARHALWSFEGGALASARRELEAALDLAGPNELLYSTLGWLHLQYVEAGVDDGIDHFTIALECVNRALAINAISGPALALRGTLHHHRGDIQTAVYDLRQAVHVDPNHPDALIMLVYCYLMVGRASFARPFLARLRQIDPLTPLSINMQGFFELMEGRLDAALPYYMRMHEVGESGPATRLFLCWVLAGMGRVEQLQRVLDTAPRTSHSVLDAAAVFIDACARQDEEAADAAVSGPLRSAAHDVEYLSRILGDGYALLGRSEAARPWVENAVRRGFINLPYLERTSPFLSRVRDSAWFVTLLTDVERRWRAFDVGASQTTNMAPR
jgi:TolB-like protein